ncbi:uncharacterized protein STAUR_7157 [Stigmatella aurantiaca DW4/3-1]|uniref:Uncharacterized protein n=1 Tax=Stigmatella aurantiaca (strain DW4/3-1) TaxID=378806 RepID=E3FZ96_STIAD|nr:uncharacterized protein STAUR_7157 [Stigmatella aurantiaca DW4/3-1]
MLRVGPTGKCGWGMCADLEHDVCHVPHTSTEAYHLAKALISLDRLHPPGDGSHQLRGSSGGRDVTRVVTSVIISYMHQRTSDLPLVNP